MNFFFFLKISHSVQKSENSPLKQNRIIHVYKNLTVKHVFWILIKSLIFYTSLCALVWDLELSSTGNHVLIICVCSSAKTVKTTFGMEQSVAAYTNRVYAGWDYAITNRKANRTKHRNLYSEFKVSSTCNPQFAQQKSK